MHAVIDECITHQHDCDKNAKCIDTDDAYLCECLAGFVDQSPDAKTKPGRVCALQSEDIRSMLVVNCRRRRVRQKE